MKYGDTMERFVERIRQAAEESVTHRQVAEYLSDHLREVSFMTSAELAKNVGVSQASVTRFCNSMGFSGFGEFVRALQDIVREEWRAPERTVYLRPSIPQDADPLLAQEITNLEHLPEILDSKPMQRLVNLMASMDQIVLAGARISSTLIPYAAYCLTKVRDGVQIATPGSPLWDNLALSHPDRTLILSWVFPRYSRALLDWMDAAAKESVHVAALTDRWMSPAMAMADPVLVIPVSNASLFDSYVAPMFVVNYLIRQVAQRLPQVRERLEQLEERDQRLGVYWTRPSRER
ncbi:MAG: MurR/RpiR family transcriptional regulator [Sulfobacillus benefaciens]|uniref:MurR/RpiR family transcriptional regulator n=1 Tax=Sulfobacillus benefaciens TaxID=453960 RepID=A0A2T2XCR6_9FIRM|nr:MAG: MurR/RpiR family transcriptional regulator [Sulfobacillus benefaciens]